MNMYHRPVQDRHTHTKNQIRLCDRNATPPSRLARQTLRLSATQRIIMPAALPTVTVQNGNGASCAMPEVFLSPIRADIVNAVHTGLAKNDSTSMTMM